jgi:hypothetical protein
MRRLACELMKTSSDIGKGVIQNKKEKKKSTPRHNQTGFLFYYIF